MAAENHSVRRVLEHGLPDRVVNQASLHLGSRVPHACMHVVVVARSTVSHVDRLVVTGKIDEEVVQAEGPTEAEHDGRCRVVNRDVGDDLQKQRCEQGER